MSLRLASKLALVGATITLGCGEPPPPDPPPPPATHPVQIEVTGLEGEVVVGLRGGDVETSLTVDTDGVHTFDQEVADGSALTIWIEAQPSAAGQICEVDAEGGVAAADRPPVLVSCFAAPAVCEGLFAETGGPVRFERVFAGLPPWSLEGDPANFTFTTLLMAPGDDRYWYLVAREGVVWRFENRPDVSSAEVLLDIRERVSWRRDDGLVSLAFHPDFAENGRIFLQYAIADMRARVSRFSLLDGGPSFDPASETILFEVQRDTLLHVGGMLHFGADGYLYGTMGDGGSLPEPIQNAQENDNLLGTMYRIDVDVPDGSAEAYASPPDNPFGPEGERPGEGRPEIWAWGLRNVFRWSFDSVTGTAWAGDVGHHLIEEIDIVEAGNNYGWPYREGSECYPPDGTVTDCPSDGLTPPVHEYGREDGASVTGGYVYRGSAIPDLYGAYVFADWVSHRVWALMDPYGTRRLVELGDAGMGLVHFAEDQRGEIYILGLPENVIKRMVRDPEATRRDVPETLSATGCMQAGAITEPVEGFVPYEINAPLWSDGASKRRWISVPEGASAVVGEDGDLDLPVGTVLAKEFSLGGRRLETRFLLHQAPDRWVGYTYRWNADETDATLVAAPETEVVDGQTWLYPGPGQCMRCHTAAAGRSLGLEVAQLDRTVDVGGAPVSQLDRLVDAGVLADVPTGFAPLARLDDADVAAAARAYLHANCAHCHRPEHGVRADIDLRASTTLADSGVCGPPRLGDRGLTDPRVVAAGAPERSVLLERIRALDEGRMPPLATGVVDDGAAAVVESWIAGLSSCPE